MIPEHLADLVAAARERRRERSRERAELDAARAAAMPHRHKNKLAHLTTTRDTDPSTQDQP